MRLKSVIKFNDPWSTMVDVAARSCGLSVDDYCKRAVQLVTRTGLEGGRIDATNGDNTATGDTQTDTGETRISEGTSAPTLSDQADASTDSKE